MNERGLGKGDKSRNPRTSTFVSQMEKPSSSTLILSVLFCTSTLLQISTSADDNGDDWESSDEGWRTATATATKDTNASILTEGACGYGELTTYGDYSTGLSTVLFNRGSTCGGCFEVRCVDHVLWCLPGSPSVVVTATDFCAPNYGLASDYGGWCNFPRRHFELSHPAFADIASAKADIVPVHYRRVPCERDGGMKFKLTGNSDLCQVLITNVGSDGEVVAVKIKGTRTGWIPMARNWGQYWESSVNLKGQRLSFEVTTSNGRTLASYNVVPANWQFGQTFEGKQIYD